MLVWVGKKGGLSSRKEAGRLSGSTAREVVGAFAGKGSRGERATLRGEWRSYIYLRE